jgi:hypothetical protein
MKNMRWVATGAVLALGAFPAAAAAQPEVRDVAKQVRSADAAFDLARQAAVDGDVDELLAQLQAERRSMARAERKADRVKGSGNSARAQRKMAAHSDESFDEFAELIDEVPADVQPIVLGALERSAAARDEAVARLTDLLTKLPPQAQAGVASAISAMQSDGDLESIADAIESPEVGAGVRAELTEVFGEVSARVGEALTRLEGLVATLPPEAQGPVQDAIDRIQGQLDEVLAILDDVLAGLSSGSGGLCDALGGFGVSLPVCG